MVAGALVGLSGGLGRDRLAGAAGSHVAPDAMPVAEAADVFCPNVQAQCGEMGAQLARAVGFARVPQQVEQNAQLPVVVIAERRAAALSVLVTFEQGEGFS